MAVKKKEPAKEPRRPRAFIIRLNESEYADLKKRSAAAHVFMSEYVRCKAFDIPLEQVGGVSPRVRRPAVPVPTI